MRKMSDTEKIIYYNNGFNHAMAIIVRFLGAVLNIGVALILQFCIDSVTVRDSSILFKGIYLLAAYLIVYLVFSFMDRKYTNRYIKKGLLQFKNYIFERILDSSSAQFQDEKSAKFLSAFSNDLNSVETHYLLGSLEMISNITHFTLAILFMAVMCWYMAVPLCVIVGICLGLAVKYGKVLINVEYSTAEQNQYFLDKVKDLLNGYIVIKSFRAEKEILEIFSKKNSELEEKKRERRATNNIVSILGDVSSVIVNSCIYIIGFGLCFYGMLTLGKVMSMIAVANYIVSPVRNLPGLISNKKAAIRLIERLDKETFAETEIEKLTQEVDFENEIVFENVSFGYIPANEVIKNLNLKFEKGKNYAIVGGSGSGKTSIFKLLLGYNKNYDGSIKIGSTELKDIESDVLFDIFSIIQQDVFLFDSSIVNNITMFKEFDNQVLEEIIKKSGLSKLIEAKGKDYKCGENGKNLSGGEKQRISIARCLIRKTPVILIDEATSSLDNITALNVEKAILGIKDATKIIITHRYNEEILRKYDEIIVLNKGKLMEKGTFDELYNKQEFFYSLYNLSSAT